MEQSDDHPDGLFSDAFESMEEELWKLLEHVLLGVFDAELLIRIAQCHGMHCHVLKQNHCDIAKPAILTGTSRQKTANWSAIAFNLRE